MESFLLLRAGKLADAILQFPKNKHFLVLSSDVVSVQPLVGSASRRFCLRVEGMNLHSVINISEYISKVTIMYTFAWIYDFS